MFAFLFAALDPNTAGLGELAKAVLDAALSGQKFLAFSLALVCLVQLLKQLPVPALKTDVGAILLNFGTSLGGALFTVAAAGAVFSWPAFWTALQFAAGASGVYVLLKKLLLPLLLKVPVIAKLWDLLSSFFPTKGEAVVLAPVPATKAPTSDQIVNGK
jgi:hypothetical protein